MDKKKENWRTINVLIHYYSIQEYTVQKFNLHIFLVTLSKAVGSNAENNLS